MDEEKQKVDDIPALTPEQALAQRRMPVAPTGFPHPKRTKHIQPPETRQARKVRQKKNVRALAKATQPKSKGKPSPRPNRHGQDYDYPHETNAGNPRLPFRKVKEAKLC